MRNKGISRLIPVLFLGMLLLVMSSLLSQKADLSLLTFRDSRHGTVLSPYYDSVSDSHFLFLPGFTRQEDLEVSHPWYLRARFSSEISRLSPEEAAQITLSLPWGEDQAYSLKLIPCSAKQTVYLEAQDGMLEEIHGDQTLEREIFVTILDEEGQTVHRSSAMLSGRGNGTWVWPKKPYDLKLSEPAAFGPFGNVEKLCLLAEYFDTSKLRNALGYTLGQAADIAYASPYDYADVYLNGEYLGLYGLATKETYRSHIEADGIQAAFELTPYRKGEPFYTEMGKMIRMYCGDEYLVYDQVYALEQSLQNQDWEALLSLIDLSSWAKKYAMEEFLYNYDLSLASQYFYLDGDGKIHCMLPWDYEWVFYARLSPHDPTDEPALGAYWNGETWYSLLLECPQFRDAVLNVWETAYTPALFQSLEASLMDFEAEIAGSHAADRIRWSAGYAVSHTAEPEVLPLSDYRSLFSRCFSARVHYLKALFGNWEDYARISFACQYGDTLQSAQLQAILPIGTDLTAYHSRFTDSLDTPAGWTLVGWFTEGGQPMESVTTLTEDITFIARYRALSQEETP